MRNTLRALIPTLVAASCAHGGACNLDQPLQWTINPIYVDGVTPSAIQGDGSSYINGQTGVTTVIDVCSGTNDATLLLGSRRTMTFSFAGLLATNSHTPAWALISWATSRTKLMTLLAG